MPPIHRREPLKEGRRICLTITLDPEAYALLDQLAIAEGLNRSAILEELVRKRAKRRLPEVPVPA